MQKIGKILNHAYIGLSWEWEPWGGDKISLPLKIFNSEVKMLKLIPNLVNHNNFQKYTKKNLVTKVYDGISISLAKSDIFGVNSQKFVIF